MKLRRHLLTTALVLSATMATAGDLDQGKPFGFCTRTSRTNASEQYAYSMTGGGCYEYPVTGVSSSKVTTLTSTGKNMKDQIANAIKKYDVIVFDGSKGDFIVSSTISLSGISNKTLLGINGARLCTTWYATQDIIDALNDAGVPTMSGMSGTGGTLSNGTYVAEEAEYNTRQIIINMTKDSGEAYRNSGIFFINGCQNIIVRNLKFVGPGSIDVGGSDLLSFYGGTKNCWVDHCDFTDGMDGNFDITQKSDFNTVTWCTFRYTDRSYMHQNTNLIGSSDSESTGYLNTTFAYNLWGTGCRARMPMARVGKIHMLNNYYECAGSGNCINPRKNSEFLIEGNYFAKGVSNYYGQSGAVAVTWMDDNYVTELKETPSSFGTAVTVPYSYSVAKSSIVPGEVLAGAGATLYTSVDGGGDSGDGGDEEEKVPELVEGNSYIVTNDETAYDGKQVVCSDITMTYGNDGEWQSPVRYGTNLETDGFIYYIAGLNNIKDDNGKAFSSSGNLPTTGTYYVFSPTADGTLYVAANIYVGKKVYLTEDGTATSFQFDGASYDSGSVLNSENNAIGYVSFNVKKGSEYYFFGEYTKIMLYGFNFVPADNETKVAPIVAEARQGEGKAYNIAGQSINGNARGVKIQGGRAVIGW